MAESTVPQPADANDELDELEDHGPGCDGPWNCTCWSETATKRMVADEPWEQEADA